MCSLENCTWIFTCVWYVHQFHSKFTARYAKILGGNKGMSYHGKSQYTASYLIDWYRETKLPKQGWYNNILSWRCKQMQTVSVTWHTHSMPSVFFPAKVEVFSFIQVHCGICDISYRRRIVFKIAITWFCCDIISEIYDISSDISIDMIGWHLQNCSSSEDFRWDNCRECGESSWVVKHARYR